MNCINLTDITLSNYFRLNMMHSKQVSREKALKSMYKLQFFIMIKKCTFCIMSWLVKINSKLKKRKKFKVIFVLQATHQLLVINFRHETI